MSARPERPLAGTTILGLAKAILLCALGLAIYRAQAYGWMFVLAALGLLVGLAQLVFRLGGRHPGAIEVLLFVGLALMPPLAGAMATSQRLWGYPLARPHIDIGKLNIVHINSITLFKTDPDRPIFSIDDALTLQQTMDFAAEEPHYAPEFHALVALKDGGLLPDPNVPMDADELAGLYRVVEETGRLEGGEPGHGESSSLSGMVVSATTRPGTRVLFIAARGGPLPRGHYPCYEFLFDGGAEGGYRLERFVHFYFDLSGGGVLEWRFLLLAYCLAEIILAMPLWGIMVVLISRRNHVHAPTPSRRPGPNRQ
jgi:hypothetical protein